MQQAFTTGTATLDGKFYQVDGALNYPLPLQQGGIPFWIAGGGEKKTLRIAAQYANYTNFDGSPQGFAHKSQVLKGHCEALGRDFESITRSANYNVVIGETEKDVADKLAWIRAHLDKTVPQSAENTASDYANGYLVGTPEQISEKLSVVQDLGMTYAITYFLDAAYDTSSIELFETKVAPSFL